MIFSDIEELIESHPTNTPLLREKTDQHAFFPSRTAYLSIYLLLLG